MKRGAHQAMEIFPPKKILLIKPRFDAIHIERLQEACTPDLNAKLAILVMEEGLANLFVMTRSTSILKQKIEKSIPKNKSVHNQYGKAKDKFFDACIQALMAKLDLDSIGYLIVGSPGFVKDNFMDYFKTFSAKSTNKSLQKLVSSTILVHTSTGFKSGLKEIIESEEIKEILKETIIGKETEIFEQFMFIAGHEEDKACYGYDAVNSAIGQKAVKDILISDGLYRCFDPVKRNKYVSLIQRAKN